ncbi:MAG: Ppx/GppA family phosphatase, partial [Thiovulaceae bacterium]|nr:Ppx/GppA family phosphatase [Sulfurimonadaceae bacterium]
KTLCVATSALRDAPNKYDFIKLVRDKLKLNIKTIDGEREAYLGGIACANLLPVLNNSLTIDIGGGSTEFAYINKKNVTDTISIDLGTVRLKELFFDKNDVDGAKKYIDKKLEVLNELKASKLIGIGGTFRAITTAIMKQEKFPLRKLHAYECKSDEFKLFLKAVLNANEDELCNLNIKENRFDIIKPGSLILQRVIEKLSINELIASGVGVREGVFLSDLLRTSKHKLPQNYNTSVRHILDAHVSDKEYSNNLNKLSKKLFDILQNKFSLDAIYRGDLAIAAKLYPSGGSIHQFAQNRHSYYLIQSSLEYGFTQKQMVLISTLVRYAKRKLPSTAHIEKYQVLLPDTNTLNTLSYILTLSIYLLNHRPRNIDFEAELIDNKLIINSKNKMYLAKEDIKNLEDLKDLEIVFN